MSGNHDPEACFDLVLVGGGLQSALVALAVLARRPEAAIAIVERGAALGGAHTWCFHAADVPEPARAFVAPLIEHRWPGYRVDFPRRSRRLDCEYAGLSSAHLHRVLSERLAGRADCKLLLGAEAVEIGARSVRLADGRRLGAPLVIDARGPAAAPPPAGCGFQKFLGQELEFAGGHGIELPIVMDACVDQREGFRFLYVLPLGPQRLLVEDTRFTDTPLLPREALRAAIAAWTAQRGLHGARIVREEEGILPMPWQHRLAPSPASPFVLGYRGGWMHPATGYSFPVAVQLALCVAEHPDEDGLAAGLRELAAGLRGDLRFAQLLNRLLFRWFAPEQRIHVFERFYGLPAPTVRRFYALRTTLADRVRILAGRPPRGFSLRARLAARTRQEGALAAREAPAARAAHGVADSHRSA